MSEDKIKTIYTDGIGKIHFFGNMLRLDLMDFVPSESEDANAKPEPKITARIVMSPNAFLASYESFINMIDKLTKAGVLSQTDNKSNDTEGEKTETAEESNKDSATTVENI